MTRANRRPRISVVVPSFEQAGFLRECLDSILEQEWDDLELVVIDGGSKDGTIDILREYSSRITYWVSEPDRGQSDAINKGFEQCTGDLVTFFGSDDRYLPGCFADLARLYSENNMAGAYVGAFRFMNESSEAETHLHPPHYGWTTAKDLALANPREWRLHQVATFFNRKWLDRAGRRVREDMCYVMDRELLYRVCRQAPPALSNRAWAHFRRHPKSKSVSAIVPFSAELAALHLFDRSPGEPHRVRRSRRRFARHHRMRGYIKYAKAVGPGPSAVTALCRALAVNPALLIRPAYARAWLEALHLSVRENRPPA